ncbi:MAG: SDR family NAD(P)-dependent oxidoreductase [Ehrlichia sp.]
MLKTHNQKGAIVTGGAKRLGKAIAIFLASNGYDIVVHYHTSKEHALNTKNIIEELCNQKCTLIQTDLTVFDSLSNLMDKAFEAMPYCNCLINNASVFYRNMLMNTTIEDFIQNYNIHIQAPLFLTQYFTKKCAAIGNVINMTDTMVLKDSTKYFTYTMSKKSLTDFTKFAAVELWPQIKVNAIGPRMVHNDFLNNINYDNIMENREVRNILHRIKELLNSDNNETGTISFM